MNLNPPATLLALALTLAALPTSLRAAEPAPDFGPSVLLLDPASPNLQSQLNDLFKKQEKNQFGPERYAILLKPGNYNLNLNVGFYTQVAGLGKSPDDTTLTGTLQVKAGWMRGNATCNFWRSAENLAVIPTADRNTMVWAVSQGTSLRRLHVKGNLNLWESGWSSGGFLADSKIDGKTTSGSQQQWLSRNTEWSAWNGGVWNMVFVGAKNAPAEDWPKHAYTVIEKTPTIREKPFLTLDANNQYAVIVPNLAKHSAGTTWSTAPTPATTIPINQFHIALPNKDTAATLNAALKAGKNLLLTPGIYHLDSEIQITRPDTVVLGLGFPTLIPDKGTPALTVADIPGVKLAGLLLEAGPQNSPTLLQVGDPKSNANHAENPTSLHDIFCRVGGANPGLADSMITLNSNHTIGDNFWLWRADHGAGANWIPQKNANGITINGKSITLYGLFVEHTQGYQTLWNGNDGKCFFYQSEMPYDVPSQEAWKNGNTNGFASYKVSNDVTTHEAHGLGIYSLFLKAPILADSAIEAPDSPSIKFRHTTTIRLGGQLNSGISHILNQSGPPVIKTMKATD